MNRRVLIVTHEMLPFPAGPASGGGLRVWGLAQGLEARGFDVVVSMPEAYLDGRADVPPAVRQAAYRTREIPRLLDRHRPDVLILEQPRALGWHEQLGVPTVIDLPGPVFLENLYLGRPADAELREKIYALSYGDLFLVSHPRQTPYFLAWLALAGVDLLADRVAVVPFCLPPELPAPAERALEPRFVYAGTFHPWQDPTRALGAVLAELDALGRGELEVIGGRHPVDLYGEGVYRDPLAGLSPSPRLLRADPLPWDAYNARLCAGWALVNVLASNREREIALPIRELNAMWCGLPPIVSPESPFAAEIARRGAGWVVDPAEPEALRGLVRRIASDRRCVDEAAEAARSLVRGHYTWDVAVEPLAAFCADPVKRPERGRSQLVEATDRDLVVRYCTELGQVAEAHRHTQDALRQQQDAYARLEGQLERLGASLVEREAALGQAREDAARRAHEHAAALEREQRHKREVSHRLAADLEAQRRRAVALEGELNALRRSISVRAARWALRLARPVAALVALALLALVLHWSLPAVSGAAWSAYTHHPLATGAGGAALGLTALATCVRLRFRWRWLVPTRARWLGAIKLAFLFVLSLVLLVYLKVWERLHRIRVFP